MIFCPGLGAKLSNVTSRLRVPSPAKTAGIAVGVERNSRSFCVPVSTSLPLACDAVTNLPDWALILLASAVRTSPISTVELLFVSRALVTCTA